MIIKFLNGLLGAATLVALGACSTPCGTPGGLCAPIQANTSSGQSGTQGTVQSGSRADAVPAGRTAPAANPMLVPGAQAAQPSVVQTMPVEPATPANAPAAVKRAGPTRIAVLLPLRSETLGVPADALRAGFMAAYERDKDGIAVTMIETGDSADETLNAYMAASKTYDIIVGPLSRSAVTAVADSGTVTRPTIALNHPDGRTAIPASMLVVGLSIEEEARQVARWAASEHPAANALIVSGPSSWQRRIASAFAAEWKQIGNRSQLVEVTATNGYLQEAALNQLRTRLDAEPASLLFAALDHDQLRQVRATLGTDLPAYGTSSVNPGADAGMAPAELDGTRMLDLPWQVQADHSAVMVYPRWTGPRRTLDMDRLYALGIDAFRIAREISLRPASSFKMDGVTGRLSVSFGQGPARFERLETGTVYQGGSYKLVEPVR